MSVSLCPSAAANGTSYRETFREPVATPSRGRGAFTFAAMWPVLDEDMTLAELSAEAFPEMHRLAGEAGALIVGKISFSVGTGPGDTAVLYGRAPADLRPEPLVKAPDAKREPDDDLPQHGTPEGYSWHRKFREEACADCKAARAAQARGKRANAQTPDDTVVARLVGGERVTNPTRRERLTAVEILKGQGRSIRQIAETLHRPERTITRDLADLRAAAEVAA